MVSVNTVLGFGFVVPRALAQSVIQETKSKFLVPMCHTCGQSSYFFGYRIESVNSTKGYKKFITAPFFTYEAYLNALNTLTNEYKKLFKETPVDKPTYLMYTDIVRS